MSHYRAVHGNGYSVTTSSAERLSPGIGYWDTEDDSGGSGGGGSASPTESGGSGGGGTATSYSIGVFVNTANKTWIETNVNSGDKLWFWTQDGGNYQLNHSSSNYFTWTGTLAANDEIVGFYITNSSGTGYKDFSVTSTYVVTQNYNVSYYINNDDVMVLN